MKKSLKISLLLIVILLISAPQIFALEIKITKDGNVYFYEDTVLGDDDAEENEIEDEDEDENETEDQVDDEDENEHQVEEIRSTNLNRGSVRIETIKDEIRVDLINKVQNSKSKKSGFNQMESSKVNRLRLEIPSGQGDEENLEESKDSSREEYKEYLKKLKEARKERSKEKVELRNRQQESGEQEIELESRGVSARLKNAEFSYDSDLDQIILTTPSGNVHVLNHLPDQAKLRMELVSNKSLDNSEIEIETSEDGAIKYKVKGFKIAKLFGLFSRNIETEILLDDDSGEVTETELNSESILGRLLDRWSF